MGANNTHINFVVKHCMNDNEMKRPKMIQAAIFLYVLYWILEFVDQLTYQYVVSPDYAPMYWMFIFPFVFLIFIIGLFFLRSRKFYFAISIPVIMALGKIYFTVKDKLPGAPGWPAETPTLVYLAILAAIFILLIQPISLLWFQNASKNA